MDECSHKFKVINAAV